MKKLVSYRVKYADGYEAWWLNGKLHRTDGPAVEGAYGYKEWWVNGKRHRNDGPAIEYTNGHKAWYVEGVKYTKEEFNDLSFMTENSYGDKVWENPKGQFHRTDGPAVVYPSGDKAWYQNDKLHRTDGPAVEYGDGNKEWWVNDKLHRTDGPALEYANGYKAWYVEGVKYTEEKFNNLSFMTETENGTKIWKNAKGQFHRTDGPAVVYLNGNKFWYQNGKLHRTDGPALEYEDGYKAWYQNDKLHRIEGPAIEYENGDKEWWLDGIQHKDKSFKFGDMVSSYFDDKTMIGVIVACDYDNDAYNVAFTFNSETGNAKDYSIIRKVGDSLKKHDR